MALAHCSPLQPQVETVHFYWGAIALVDYGHYPEAQVPFETQGNFGGELSLLDGEVNITFIPAVHSSAVASDGSPANYAGHPGGFLVSIADGPTIYHTGDTDVFADMALISKFQATDGN